MRDEVEDIQAAVQGSGDGDQSVEGKDRVSIGWVWETRQGAGLDAKVLKSKACSEQNFCSSCQREDFYRKMKGTEVSACVRGSSLTSRGSSPRPDTWSS